MHELTEHQNAAFEAALALSRAITKGKLGITELEQAFRQSVRDYSNARLLTQCLRIATDAAEVARREPDAAQWTPEAWQRVRDLKRHASGGSVRPAGQTPPAAAAPAGRTPARRAGRRAGRTASAPRRDWEWESRPRDIPRTGSGRGRSLHRSGAPAERAGRGEQEVNEPAASARAALADAAGSGADGGGSRQPEISPRDARPA